MASWYVPAAHHGSGHVCEPHTPFIGTRQLCVLQLVAPHRVAPLVEEQVAPPFAAFVVMVYICCFTHPPQVALQELVSLQLPTQFTGHH